MDITISVNMTSASIASVSPVRRRESSGYAMAVLSAGRQARVSAEHGGHYSGNQVGVVNDGPHRRHHQAYAGYEEHLYVGRQFGNYPVQRVEGGRPEQRYAKPDEGEGVARFEFGDGGLAGEGYLPDYLESGHYQRERDGERLRLGDADNEPESGYAQDGGGGEEVLSSGVPTRACRTAT